MIASFGGACVGGRVRMKSAFIVLVASVTLSSCARASSVRSAEITPAHRAALDYLAQDQTLVPLTEPAHELRKIGERGATSASGAMVRFEQVYRGVPVMGTLLVCEVGADGAVRVRTNELRSVNVSVIPQIEARKAVRVAAASLPVKGRTRDRQTDAKLVVVPAAAIDAVKADTLAWSVTLEDVPVADRRGTWRVLIDAVTGTVLHSDELLPRD